MKQKPSETELRERLTPLQYEVTQEEGTERAFTGAYWDTKDNGLYRCIVCEEPLFSSETKYDSGTGWPSFTDALDPSKVELIQDRKFAMVRTEVRCAKCGSHLGHKFNDGPSESGARFCMNSASLNLDMDDDLDAAEPGVDQV